MAHADSVQRAIVETFQAACGIALQPQDKDHQAVNDGAIAAVISLVGDANWSTFLGLPADTAQKLAQQFAGFDIPYGSDDMNDAIGELANIFTGQVKAILDNRGVKAEISLPMVFRAQTLASLLEQSGAQERVCYDSPIGPVWSAVIPTA